MNLGAVSRMRTSSLKSGLLKRNKMDISVYADWQGLKGPMMMGTLNVTRTKGHGVFSFEYDKDWLKLGRAQDLDPDLLYYGGPQYLGNDKPNFGAFMDSSPDRWGKEL